MNRSSFLSLALCLASLGLGTSCGDSLQIPIPLESPAQEINATEQVDSFESTLCDDPESENCLVIQALDYSDDENVSDPPVIPAEIPIEVALVEPTTGTPLLDENGEPRMVNVEEWVNESGFKDNLDLSQSVDVDLSDELAEKGIATDAVIDSVSISSFALNYIENSLTFSGAELDLYASVGKVEDSSDTAQLIADGVVQKIGTVPAQNAETAGEAPIAFANGGNAILNEALKAASFTLVVAARPESSLQLAQGATADLVKKPTGIAEISVKAELLYTITSAGLLDF